MDGGSSPSAGTTFMKRTINIKHSTNFDSLELAPAPPLHLMEYRESEQAHFKSGLEDFNALKNFCSKHFQLSSLNRILDFGCSNARVTRWHDTSQTEVWGCDLQQNKIIWAQENLGSKIKFFLNTEQPHLPFEDNYFDFIYAHSVFTHIDNLHHAWLLELFRICKSYVMITLNDEETMDINKTPRSVLLRERFFKDFPADGIDSSIGFFASNSYGVHGLSQVYMTQKYLKSLLPNNISVVDIHPRVFANLQTGILMLKTQKHAPVG